MHIDRTNQVPVPGELARAADPISAFGFVCMPTRRTPTRCSSFGAGEAHDVSSLAFVGQVGDVLAIFPQRHTLIVVPAFVLRADTMRIADEEGSHLLLDAEVEHFARRFVSQVTNAPLGPATLLVFSMLQSLPAPGILLAPGLLLRNLAQVLRPLTLERTDAAPGDDHGSPGVGGHGCQVDLAQVHGGLDRARSFCCL